LAVYWLLFGYFAVGALIAASMPDLGERRPSVLFVIGALIMGTIIGLRYRVGGDWSSYVWIYHAAGHRSFSAALSIGDPAYQAVNWFAYQLGGEVWTANLICAAFFIWGLFRFCRTQPAPWLAAVVAIPYLVIVIAMGYTRQAVALGILMAGIAAYLREASLIRFAIYVLVAALFHKTAVIAFPVVALTTYRNRFVNLVLVVVAGLAFYNSFLGDSMDALVKNYVKAHYSAQGAAIRIIMNMVAASIFWSGSKSMMFNDLEQKIWRNFSIASVLSMVMLIMSPSSAAVDRISLYLIPLQIAVLGRVPLFFRSRLFGSTVVVGYCLIVEFVWLNFAQFASAWVPYQFFPIV
jgi:hypothetical protein